MKEKEKRLVIIELRGVWNHEGSFHLDMEYVPWGDLTLEDGWMGGGGSYGKDQMEQCEKGRVVFEVGPQILQLCKEGGRATREVR